MEPASIYDESKDLCLVHSGAQLSVHHEFGLVVTMSNAEMGNQNVTGVREEDEDATSIAVGSAKGSAVLTDTNDSEQVFKQHRSEEIATNKQSTALDVSSNEDYFKDESGKFLSCESEILDGHTGSDFCELPPTDDSLNQRQVLGVEDDRRNPTREDNCLITSIDITQKDEEKETNVACATLSGGITEKMASGTDDLGSCLEACKLESNTKSRAKEREYREERMDNNESSGTIAEKDLDGDCAMQKDKGSSTGSIETIFLDACEAEIKSFIRGEDQKAVQKLSKIKPNDHECDAILNMNYADCNIGFLEDEKSNVVQIDHVQVEVKAGGLSQGIEYLCFEQVVQTNQTKMSETEEESQHKYKSSLIPKNYEMIATPVKEEDLENEIEPQIMDSKLEEKRSSEPPSSSMLLFKPEEIVNEETVVQTQDMLMRRENKDEMLVSIQGLGKETNHFKDYSNYDAHRLLSELPNSIGMETRDMMKKYEEGDAEERTETMDRKFVHANSKVPEPATDEVAVTCKIISVEVEKGNLPLEESSMLKSSAYQPDHGLCQCSGEHELKESLKEPEMDNSTCHVSECLNIYSELPNLAKAESSVVAESSDLKVDVVMPDHSLPELLEKLASSAEESKVQNDPNSACQINESISKSEMKKSGQNESNAALSEMKIQENDGKILDSLAESMTEAQPQSLHVTGPEAYIADLKVVESNKSMTLEHSQECSIHASGSDAGGLIEAIKTNKVFTLQPNPEKLDICTDTDATEDCQLQSPNQETSMWKQVDSEEAPLLPSAENVEGPASSIKAVVEQSEKHPSDQEAKSKNGPEIADVLKQSNIGESDSSIPQLSKDNLEHTCKNAMETSDSRKLRTPLVSLMKEQEAVLVMASYEKEEYAYSNKKECDVCKPPSKVTIASPAKVKGKQKHRFSLFGNCICCTATMN